MYTEFGGVTYIIRILLYLKPIFTTKTRQQISSWNVRTTYIQNQTKWTKLRENFKSSNLTEWDKANVDGMALLNGEKSITLNTSFENIGWEWGTKNRPALPLERALSRINFGGKLGIKLTENQIASDISKLKNEKVRKSSCRRTEMNTILLKIKLDDRTNWYIIQTTEEWSQNKTTKEWRQKSLK